MRVGNEEQKRLEQRFQAAKKEIRIMAMNNQNNSMLNNRPDLPR